MFLFVIVFRCKHDTGFVWAQPTTHDDPLLAFRDRFPFTERSNYLINNSLGAMPSAARERVQQFLSRPSRRMELMESAWKHLEREMNVLKRLRHRNICQLKETFMEPGYSISE